jgi:aspartyl-tRNA(Asn)/glutamyl-tRNA(Gln) amidotransferase subunit C
MPKLTGRATLPRRTIRANFRAFGTGAGLPATTGFGSRMSVDTKTVARIAHLARLRLPEDRLEPMAGELNRVLSWVEQLSEVNTDNVKPLTSVVHARLRQRDDAVTDGDRRDDVLANAPDAQNGFYAVPKVIE